MAVFIRLLHRAFAALPKNQRVRLAAGVATAARHIRPTSERRSYRFRTSRSMGCCRHPIHAEVPDLFCGLLADRPLSNRRISLIRFAQKIRGITPICRLPDQLNMGPVILRTATHGVTQRYDTKTYGHSKPIGRLAVSKILNSNKELSFFDSDRRIVLLQKYHRVIVG